ncbi:hypothetical protein NE237_013513 [Protea cynaroides]|uniref:Uncharacterized protein n=1 Tax=Protea cynaroides TaxID=273540 RepID=A0A9Q0H029_9MAGN|nr:hypothetical protein NE237_013513 [Protea cynaroides]
MVHKVDFRKVYLVVFLLGCNVSCLHDVITYILAFTVLYRSKLCYQSAHCRTVSAEILLLNSIKIFPCSRLVGNIPSDCPTHIGLNEPQTHIVAPLLFCIVVSLIWCTFISEIFRFFLIDNQIKVHTA